MVRRAAGRVNGGPAEPWERSIVAPGGCALLPVPRWDPALPAAKGKVAATGLEGICARFVELRASLGHRS
ncbi:hypothetical protein GCM10018953_01190 [Streptosporangium nondiastaticum]